jgi:GTP-binding protein EngB required for normal cell division/molybdopterin converting factor small subunit
VRAPDGSSPLLAALDELSGLAGDDDRIALDALRGRLAGQRLRVLVAGEAKRGKSTLVNALLGRPLLPVGVTPLTALATTVRYGRDEGVSAVFRDGRAESFPLSALGDLVTERGNPGNRRDLASVTVVADAPVLARGAELVDTPGTGSVYARGTAEAEAALGTMDAAVFVLTADPPVSATERELMARVAELSVTMFVVLNKADYLAGGDLAEALEFTAQVAAGAAGRPVRPYPLSARAALAGGDDPGFAAFAADFTTYLERGRAADLQASVAAHARRLAASLRDEVTLARHAAQMRTGAAAGRVDGFAARLAAVRGRRQDAADLAAAESARMLAALNEAAGQAARECAGRVGARLEALLAGELRSAGPAGIERAGRARLAELAVTEAEAWRQQQAERLEEGLARLDARLTRELRAELDAVRDAAAELLGLTLAVPGPGERLAPDLRFFYLAGGQAGQTELLAGAIRRWVPGEAGRRRARAYLHREAAALVPQQIGRARADLQYRLAEATRQLVRAVADRYAESTGRLESALRTAAAARAATADDAAQLDTRLADRQRALGHVLSLLPEVTGGTRAGGPERARRTARDGAPAGDRDGAPAGDRDGAPAGDRDGAPAGDRDGAPAGRHDETRADGALLGDAAGRLPSRPSGR